MVCRTALVCLVVALLCNDSAYLTTQPSSPPPSSKSQDFLNNAKSVTITNLDVMADDAFSADRENPSIAIDSIVYKSTADQPGLNIDRDRFYQIVREQKELNDGMQTQLDIFDTGKKFVSAFADLGGPVGIFAATATDTYLDRFNEKLRSEMEGSRRDLARQFFAGRTLNVDKLLAKRAQGLAAFAKEIESQAGLPDAFDDLPQEQREPALVRLGEFTLATVALQGQEFAVANNANKAEFKRLRLRIGNIETCQHELASKMNNLMVQTEANTAQLQKVTKELDDQHQDLGLMQKVMFSHLTVDEQLDLVTNSKDLPLTDDQRQSVVENLTKRKELLDSARKWNKFVHTGNDLIGIADKLGVDKDIVQHVAKGLAAGDTTYSAINAALSGNYLGAITAVLGIFGGGGMDVESAHYAAIMAKLDEVIETQKKIIAIQQAILKELGQIETLIIHNQIELRGTLADIFSLQASTLDAVIQIKKTDLNACDKFLDDRAEYDKFVPTNDTFLDKNGRFTQYAAMQDYFARRWQGFATCKNALDESIANISGEHGIFFGYPVLENKAAKTPDTRIVQVLEPVHTAVAPFFSYLKYFVPDTDPEKKTVKGSFFAPSVDFNALLRKENILGLDNPTRTGPDAAQDSTTPPVKSSAEATKFRNLWPISTLKYSSTNPAVGMFYSNFSSELLSPDEVIQYVKVELEVNNYRELISLDGHTLRDLKDIYRGLGDRNSSEIALKSAFDWLTLAAAQQTFLGGDTLLPFLVTDGFADYTPPELTRSQLVDEPKSKDVAHGQQLALAHYLLGHNSVLLQNAIRFRIFKQMSDLSNEKRLTAFGYAWAYSHPETPIYLQTLLHDILPVGYIEKKATDGPEVPPTGWYYKYAFTDYTGADPAKKQETVMVPLPPTEDVTDKAFVISTPLRRLLECREKINALLSTNRLLEEASKKPTDFRELKLMLLLQHYQPPPVSGSQ
jgi:hypothetical protein